MKHLNFKNKFNRTWITKLLPNIVSGAGSANIGILFLLALGNMLSGVGHFIVMPISIGTNLIDSALSISNAYAKKKKHGKNDKLATTHAAVTTVTALGIVAAVICTFVGTAALATIAPFLLTGALSVRTLYDLAAGSYCWYKYCKYRNTNKHLAAKYYKKAKGYTVAFVASALLTAAAAGVLIAHKSSFGALGVVGGGIGVGYAGYCGYKSYRKYKAKAELAKGYDVEIGLVNLSAQEEEFSELTNNAMLHANLSYSSSMADNSGYVGETLVITPIMPPGYVRTEYTPDMWTDVANDNEPSGNFRLSA